MKFKVLVFAATFAVGSAMVLTGCAPSPQETSSLEVPTFQITNYDDYRTFVASYGPRGQQDDPVAPAATLDAKAKTFTAQVYRDENGDGLYDPSVDTTKLVTAVFSVPGWQAVNRHVEKSTDASGNTMTIRGAFNPTGAQQAVDLFFFETWVNDLPYKSFTVVVGAGGDVEAKGSEGEGVAKLYLRKSRSSLTDVMVSAALDRLGVPYELKGNKSTPADLAEFLENWKKPGVKIVRDAPNEFATLNAVDANGKVVAQIDVSYLTDEQVEAALAK